MTTPDEDLLTTTEGVDEGSAASTAEGPQSGAGPVDAGTTGGPESESTPAPPVDMEGPDSRAARDAVGTGQQLQVGEG